MTEICIAKVLVVLERLCKKKIGIVEKVKKGKIKSEKDINYSRGKGEGGYKAGIE